MVSYIQMRSWEAWCFLYIQTHSSTTNQSTVPVKIDGRQQQEETLALLKTGHQCIYTRRTCSGLQVQYLQETNAKLGGVVLYGGIRPNCNIHSVNCTCEN